MDVRLLWLPYVVPLRLADHSFRGILRAVSNCAPPQNLGASWDVASPLKKMYAPFCVCTYVLMYIELYVHIRLRKHMCLYVYIYIYIYIYVCVCVCVPNINRF